MADARIAIAITTDPVHEGGYVNNPDDPGGATKYGITQRDADVVWPGLNVKDLTLEQAQEFYFTTTKPERYWNPLYASIASQQACNKIFDLGVLFGVEESVKMAQAAAGTDQDGDFGPATLDCINKTAEDEFLSSFKLGFLQYVQLIVQKNSHLVLFQNGWINRIRSEATAPVPYKD